MKTSTITRQYRYPAGGVEITLATEFEGDVQTCVSCTLSTDNGNLVNRLAFTGAQAYQSAQNQFNKAVENWT